MVEDRNREGAKGAKKWGIVAVVVGVYQAVDVQGVVVVTQRAVSLPIDVPVGNVSRRADQTVRFAPFAV